MATASTAPRRGLPRRLHALRAGLRAALRAFRGAAAPNRNR